MLSLDEAIAIERQQAKEQRSNIGTWDNEYSKKCEEWAKEHEQVAEWLEELKALKNGLNIKCDNLNEALEKGKKIGYNKAIDDFVKFANTMPTVEEEDGTIRPMWLEEMAEKLKAGGENDNLRKRMLRLCGSRISLHW